MVVAAFLFGIKSICLVLTGTTFLEVGLALPFI